MGVGAGRDLHIQASFSSPIISSLTFHFVASVNWRMPLMKVSQSVSFWLCWQTDVGIWIRTLMGQTCSSGVKGGNKLYWQTCMRFIHCQTTFSAEETLSESVRTWIFFFLLLFFLIQHSSDFHLTDRLVPNLKKYRSFSISLKSKALSFHRTRVWKNDCSPFSPASQWGCWV